MSPEEQVEDFEQNMKYWPAKRMRATVATSIDFEKPEFTVEESSVEDDIDLLMVIRQSGILEGQFLLKRIVSSPLTLKLHSAGPAFLIPESPFEVLDEKLAIGEKIRKLISYIRDESDVEFAQELADRLNSLFEAAKEEDPDEVPISPESLSNFIGFLQKTTNLRRPDVVLTPSNEICAQWRTAPNRHFSVVFLPSGETRYVIFTPNLGDPDKIDRLSGITYVDSLIDTAEPHRVLEWASK